MMTWYLWRWLSSPPRYHPLYRLGQRRDRKNAFTVSQVYLIGLGLLMSGACVFILLPARLILCPLALVPLMMLLFSSTLYGAYFTFSISRAVMREMRGSTYDLLSMTPAGGMAIDLIVCTSCLHRHKILQGVSELRGAVVGCLIVPPILLVIMLLVAVLINKEARGLEAWLTMVIVLLCVTVALHIDHIQAIVLSSLVGMTLPHLRGDHIDTSLAASALFITLQLVTYGTVLAPLIYLTSLPLSGWQFALLLLALLIVFYLLREGMITAFWSLLWRRLNAHKAELTDLRRFMNSDEPVH